MGAEFWLPIDWLPRAEGIVHAGTADAALRRGSRWRWMGGTLGVGGGAQRGAGCRAPRARGRGEPDAQQDADGFLEGRPP